MGIINWLKGLYEKYLEWERRNRERRAEARKKAEAERIRQNEIKAEQERQEREAEEKRLQEVLRLEKVERQRKATILRMLEDDKLPDMSDAFKGYNPFKFQKSEHLIWVFDDVKYLENKIKREIVGRTAGASFRVMKGVSVRTSGSRGTPVETEETIPRGIGPMAITTKHLYFKGERSFRIPFGKMVSIEPYSDGVEITRDRANALPEFFIIGEKDAPFAYGLLQAVPSLDIPRKPEFHDPETYLQMLQTDGGDMMEFVEE